MSAQLEHEIREAWRAMQIERRISRQLDQEADRYPLGCTPGPLVTDALLAGERVKGTKRRLRSLLRVRKALRDERRNKKR